MNQRTGQVTLCDAKYRSSPTTIQPSPTFTQPERLKNAVDEAIRTIQSNTTLAPDVRAAAIRELQQGSFRTRTVGFGLAKNSTLH